MRKSIYFALISLGITAVSGQIILIRELFTAFYGNELSIGVMLAIWLFGGALGSGCLGYFTADRLRGKIPVFSSVQILIAGLMPLGVILARISRAFFDIPVGEIIGLPLLALFSSFALLPIAVGLGFLFVIGCKIVPETDPARGIGRVYTLEAAGAMLGGIVTSLFLIRFLGALEIAFLLSALNLISAFFLLRKKLFCLLALFLLTAFFLTGGLDLLDKRSFDIKWSGFRVLESADSVYGRTTVTKRGGQINFFNNGLLLFSTHDPLTAEEAVHFALAASQNPETVLLIGGGASEITREILKHPVKNIDYIELDPLIVDLSKKYLSSEPFYELDNPRVKTEFEDGRFFVKQTSKKYDVVIINLPNPYTAQINRFYTKEFFREIKKVLRKNAIVTFGVTSSENYISREQALLLRTLYDTAKTEFSEVKITPGDTAYFLLSNRKNVISLNPEDISRRLKERGVNTFYVQEYYLSSKLSSERIQYLDSAIRSAGRVRNNMDFYPVSYFYDMVLWSTHFSFKLAGIFLFLSRGHLLRLTAGIFAVIFFAFFLRRRGGNFRKETVLLALGTTGLSEISFQILVILGFQIIYGYLYYKIGLIVTSFMLGLGLGSALVTKKIRKIPHPFRSYVRVQIFVMLYPMLLLLCFKILSSVQARAELNIFAANLFAFLPFVAGFAGGVQYPLANKICMKEGHLQGRTAGLTYSVDLAGSFIGAILLSSFFIPILGIATTCVLVFALNALSLLLLLMSWRAD